MRAYEIVHILDASLDRAAVDAKLETFLATLGGEVTAVDHWGVRQLAYPIGKSATGYYVIVQVTADPTALPEFERLLKLDEETMRYLIVLDEGQPTSGASVLADRPPPAPTDARGGGDGDGGDGKGSGDGGTETSGDDGNDGDGEEDAEGGAGNAEGDAGDGDGAAADGGDGDAGEGRDGEGGDADDAAAEDAEDDSEAAEPSGPPVFTGARGRRRRHEGPPIVLLNYKDVATLSRFLTEQGKILPKRTTKVSARFQRQLGTAIKRARHLALLPYIRDHGA